MSQVAVKQEVDARGSACPGPMMELIRAIRAAQPGEVIAVLSSDQGSKADIPEWVEKAGHELISQEEQGGYFRFVVRKIH